ncbi:MAG: 23S rRNA (guanosine(2251)-2'-O)-methyltransferase RlmB [Deltaproteobacteria bacterium]|nr:23S rRNA (guanosine(2251)-2'-O)-methyltransferase RlmB [Deltaproteobacteria bacterium]
MPRIIFGVNPVLEALRAHPDQVERILVAEGAKPHAIGEIHSRAGKARVRVETVPRNRLDAAAEGGVHQGVVAEVAEFKYVDLEDLLEGTSDEPPLIVLLDGIQDPHNLGALIRSAHAFGADGVVIPQDRASGVTAVAAKASAGAVEHCKVARVVNLSRAVEQLKEANIWTAAAVVDGDKLPWELDLAGPSAIVIGAEGTGVRPLVAKTCDFRVRIPMAGSLGSLNASAAGATLLYEAMRQRTKTGR